MKKYITTDKHPELKEGVIFEEYNGEWISKLSWSILKKKELKAELEKGTIKELQEPVWTDEDVKNISCEFASYLESEWHQPEKSYGEIFEQFKKEKNK